MRSDKNKLIMIYGGLFISPGGNKKTEAFANTDYFVHP